MRSTVLACALALVATAGVVHAGSVAATSTSGAFAVEYEENGVTFARSRTGLDCEVPVSLPAGVEPHDFWIQVDPRVCHGIRAMAERKVRR